MVLVIPIWTDHEGKLKKAKNAWRPSFHEANVEDEAAKTAEVKKMRVILNELTRQRARHRQHRKAVSGR